MIATIRNYLLKQKYKKMFPKVQICMPSYLEFIDKIDFNGYCYIGPEAYWSAKGGITIGNNVIFGPKTTIWTYNHNYNSETMLPYDSTDVLAPVTIEDNVWVGLGAIILPGVVVGEGAVVGAGSVVRKSIPPRAIVSGNPACVVRERDPEIYAKLKRDRQFYLDRKFAPQR